jgi:hypothetical protein
MISSIQVAESERKFFNGETVAIACEKNFMSLVKSSFAARHMCYHPPQIEEGSQFPTRVRILVFLRKDRFFD